MTCAIHPRRQLWVWAGHTAFFYFIYILFILYIYNFSFIYIYMYMSSFICSPTGTKNTDVGGGLTQLHRRVFVPGNKAKLQKTLLLGLCLLVRNCFSRVHLLCFCGCILAECSRILFESPSRRNGHPRLWLKAMKELHFLSSTWLFARVHAGVGAGTHGDVLNVHTGGVLNVHTGRGVVVGGWCGVGWRGVAWKSQRDTPTPTHANNTEHAKCHRQFCLAKICPRRVIT